MEEKREEKFAESNSQFEKESFEETKDEDLHSKGKFFEGFKEKSMEFVSNITEKVEIWARIISTRVKISSYKKEIEEYMKKIGYIVYYRAKNLNEGDTIEIEGKLFSYIKNINSIKENIKELEDIVKELEKKRNAYNKESKETESDKNSSSSDSQDFDLKEDKDNIE